MSIFDALYSGLSSLADSILQALWSLLSYIGRTIESLVMALIGPAIDAVIDPLSGFLSDSWRIAKPWFLAVNYFLPLKEAFTIIVVLWLLWGLIVVIRWVLKFVPTLSS